MSIFHLYKVSLSNPKKMAAVRIVPIGKIMKFVFSFIFLLTLISFISLIGGIRTTANEVDEFLTYIEEIEWLLYPVSLIILFVSTTVYHFIKISLFAFAGVLFLRIRNKKGEYRHLWRTAALAVTGPSILSVALSYTGIGAWGPLMMTFVTFGIIWAAAAHYPNLPQRPSQMR